MVHFRFLMRVSILCACAGSFYDVADAQDDLLPRCGNEGERPCTKSEFEWEWRATGKEECDAGLTSQRAICVKRNRRGKCKRWEHRCLSSTRHVLKSPANQFPGSWTEWALANQRDLAQDEPINWVMHLATHNAMNARLDRYTFDPNQYYSMTGQLNLGARVLALDVHWKRARKGKKNPEHARLCHGPLCGKRDRLFANGIKEIRNWLNHHPREIVLIQLEDEVPEGPLSPYINRPLEAYFGSGIFTPEDLGCTSTFPEALRNGAAGLHPDRACEPGVDFWPSRRELLAEGKRVIIFDKPSHFGRWAHRLASVLCGDGMCFNYDFDGTNVSEFDLRECRIKGTSVVEANLRFSTIFEDRTLFAGAATGTGWMKAADVEAAAKCNVNFITFDFLSSLERVRTPATRKALVLPELPDNRQRFAVWSWKSGDRGDRGDCALLARAPDTEAPNNHWESRSCGEVHRFACSRPRAESGLAPSDWQDPLGEDWKVTTRTGPWEDGHMACRVEHPGSVFGVPVNGYQNERLKAVVGATDVWLNYTDQVREGEWVITGFDDPNVPPAIR